MLSQNIKNLRKQKGYTQETFAQELNVVRQTVSKWEKGYSVPDALMLEKIAELLEVSVGDLLSDGEVKAEEKPDLKEIADQLSILNNQYAKEMARRKRNRKIALIVVSVFLSIALIVAVISMIPHDRQEYEIADDGGIVLSNLDKELDEAVSKAIISENEKGVSSGEFTTESHVVYGTEEKDGTIKVYLFENHTGFGFKDGFFTDVSGGRTPSVLTFKASENGFELLSRETAGDGADYDDSIKRLFPSRLAKKCLSGLSDAENERMWFDQVNAASEYLESIGRGDTIVCAYREIKSIFFTDYGISEEVSNKITELCNEYDYTIGNHEKIENGKRFVYQTGYDYRKNRITFTKFEYETGKIVEFIEVDGKTGEIVKEAEKPEKVDYYKGELDPISGNEWTTTSVNN